MGRKPDVDTRDLASDDEMQHRHHDRYAQRTDRKPQANPKRQTLMNPELRDHRVRDLKKDAARRTSQTRRDTILPISGAVKKPSRTSVPPIVLPLLARRQYMAERLGAADRAAYRLHGRVETTLVLGIDGAAPLLEELERIASGGYA